MLKFPISPEPPMAKTPATWYCFVVRDGANAFHFGTTPSIQGRGGTRGLRPPTSWKGYPTPVILLYAEEFDTEEAAQMRYREIRDYSQEEIAELCQAESNHLNGRELRVM
jgi:predicted GIY-YIG superfamily endonuclease